MQDMMLDIETFGTRPGSVIVSIGAVMFDPYGKGLGAEFYANVSAQACGVLGMTTDKSTLAFWARPENKKALSHLSTPKPKHPRDALNLLTKFWQEHEGVRVWSHGAPFDVVLVEAAMRNVGWSEEQIPWKFYNVRDTRTLFWLVGPEGDLPRDEKLYPRHEALSDAKYQAACVQRAVSRLGTLAGVK